MKIDFRHWCEYHGMIEVLLPTDFGLCTHCGHTFRSLREWRRLVEACPEPRITYEGDGCPLCLMLRQVIRQ